ncbi:hypothetical protein B2J88_45820 [Rhodococcus sp. SRB_17]|nr:hypothetical protein [Rhodococcus sp. SRB_17]OYD60861.1 hypothetical protein BDB13_5756 [Rhodococcus sp. OK302]
MQALLTTPQQSLVVEDEPVSIVVWLTGCAGTEDDISRAGANLPDGLEQSSRGDFADILRQDADGIRAIANADAGDIPQLWRTPNPRESSRRGSRNSPPQSNPQPKPAISGFTTQLPAPEDLGRILGPWPVELSQEVTASLDMPPYDNYTCTYRKKRSSRVWGAS